MKSSYSFRIHLYGPFYTLTKKMSHTYQFPSDVVLLEEIVQKLVKEFPKIKKILLKNGNIKEFAMIVINGEVIPDKNWKKVKISPDDRISLFQGQQGG